MNHPTTLNITLEVVHLDRAKDRVHFKADPDAKPVGITFTVEDWEYLGRPVDLHIELSGDELNTAGL